MAHLKLWGGRLKFKHRSRLRYEEATGQVPVWKLGPYRVIWWSRTADRRFPTGHTIIANSVEELALPPEEEPGNTNPI